MRVVAHSELTRWRFPQVIDKEKQKDRGFAVTRIVADAGIEAAQKPIHLIVPAVTAVFSLRTVALGLQIFVENEMFRNTNKVASGSLFRSQWSLIWVEVPLSCSAMSVCGEHATACVTLTAG